MLLKLQQQILICFYKFGCNSVRIMGLLRFLTQDVTVFFAHYLTIECYVGSKAQTGGGLKGLKPPLSDQNIDVYFLTFSPTLYCKWRSGALQNVLWQYHRRSNTFVIKPSGYEFSRFEKY